MAFSIYYYNAYPRANIVQAFLNIIAAFRHFNKTITDHYDTGADRAGVEPFANFSSALTDPGITKILTVIQVPSTSVSTMTLWTLLSPSCNVI